MVRRKPGPFELAVFELLDIITEDVVRPAPHLGPFPMVGPSVLPPLPPLSVPIAQKHIVQAYAVH